jgi:alpha-L-fucosidase 2
MKSKAFFMSATFLGMFFIYFSDSLCQNTPSDLKIWFNKPADNWNEALPVGNGRLGAMIFGRVENERIELNEESVWTGESRWDANPDALKSLPKVRQLLFEGKFKEAEALAQKGILGNKPHNPVATYQALGDIYLNYGPNRGVTNYRRELDIEDAVARVTYTANGINYVREIFSSACDQAIVIRLIADKSGSHSFTLRLSRQSNNAEVSASGNIITMKEHIGNGLGVNIYTCLKIIPEGGKSESGGDSIRIDKADAVTIFLTAGTDYSGINPEIVSSGQLEAVSVKHYERIRNDHISDYQSFFNRVDLELGKSEGSFFTTDARLVAMQNGYIDYDLLELYYQFGRYLLISSSRPGDMPANLQGIWADGMQPP